jgi:hypothetical protein
MEDALCRDHVRFFSLRDGQSQGQVFASNRTEQVALVARAATRSYIPCCEFVKENDYVSAQHEPRLFFCIVMSTM